MMKKSRKERMEKRELVLNVQRFREDEWELQRQKEIEGIHSDCMESNSKEQSIRERERWFRFFGWLECEEIQERVGGTETEGD